MVLTDKELNEYLISIGGLTNVFTGNKVTDSDFFQVSLGWNLIIKNLIQDLIRLGWNKEVIQVKEKFGGLRFYINEGTDEIHQRIGEAELESMKTCEITGRPGKLRTDIGWYRTLCDEEYERCLKIKKD
jgi:hypothetical protein